MNIMEVKETNRSEVIRNNLIKSMKKYSEQNSQYHDIVANTLSPLKISSSKNIKNITEPQKNLMEPEIIGAKYNKIDNYVEISINNFNIIIYNENRHFVTIIDQSNNIYIFWENKIYFFDDGHLILCSNINHMIPIFTHCKYSFYPTYIYAIENMQNYTANISYPTQKHNVDCPKKTNDMDNIDCPKETNNNMGNDGCSKKTHGMNLRVDISKPPPSYLDIDYFSFDDEPVKTPKKKVVKQEPTIVQNKRKKQYNVKEKKVSFDKEVSSDIVKKRKEVFSDIVKKRKEAPQDVIKKRKYVSHKKLKNIVEPISKQNEPISKQNEPIVQSGKHKLLIMHNL